MKKSISLFIFFIQLLSVARAQIAEKYYGTIPRSEVILEAIVSSDKGKMCVGYTFNPAANVNTDCLLMKTDSNNIIVWTKELATPNIDKLYSVVETYDGNFVAVGLMNGTSIYNGNVALAIKFDINGNLLWQKQFVQTGPGEIFLNVKEHPVNHHLICAGSYNFTPGANSGMLIDLDPVNGNVLWAKNYDYAGSNQFYSLCLIGNKIYAIGFYQGATFYDGYLASVDESNGNIIWSRSYEFGSVLAPGTACNWFTKTQSEGNTIYINNYISNDYVNSGSQTNAVLSLDSNGQNPLCLEMRKPGSTFSNESSICIKNGRIYVVNHPGTVNYNPIFNTGIGTFTEATISKFVSLNANNNPLLFSKKVGNAGDQGVYSINVNNSRLLCSGMSINDPMQIGNIDCFTLDSDTNLASNNNCIMYDTTLLLANPAVSVNPFVFSTVGVLNFTNNNIALAENVNPFQTVVICLDTLLTTDVTAHFHYSFPNACDSLTIQFTDSSYAINSNLYSWFWDFGDGNTSNSQNPLHTYSSSGSYTVMLIVQNNLFDVDTFTLNIVINNSLPQIVAIASPQGVCPGGSVTLTGSGAVTYNWTGGVSNGVPFSPAATNTYTVTGTDQNGCTNTSSVTVTVFPQPNITANASPPVVCPGVSTVLTGSGGYTYSWSGGITNGVPFVPTTTTTYTVTGTDANGCTNISTVTVTVNANIPITVVPNTPILCLGDSVQLTASGASNYNWSNVPGLNTYSGPTVWAQPTVGTTYTVTGTDANGCTGTASVFITVANEIYVEATKSADIECNNHSIQLHASGAANYSWTPTNLLNNANVADPYASVYETTTFYVTGTLGSCVASDSITVYAYNNDEGSIFIPNAFSPNGDNLNDCLKVKENAKFQKFYFTIYNRWGQRVFEADNPDMCWDGMLNGHPSEVGVYFYYLQAETNCGKIFKKGDITLLR